MNIFVGNLLFDATQGDVKKLFEGFGNVASVVIVMEKEKKTPKSRGFGFVEMPDEQQALAAIAALNGKEFMGRVLDVNPARPKTEAHRESKLKKKAQPKFEAKAEEYLQKERERGKTWFSPVFNKYPALTDRRVRPSGQHLALKDGRVRPSGQHLAFPDHNVRNKSGSHQRLLDGREKDGRVRPSGQPGTYKGGRRTRSYMKRHGLTEMQEEAKPRQRSQDNPMRWRKKKDKPRPWQKSPGEHKPWEKTEGESKSWKKPAGEAKPWSKSSGRPQKSRFNPSTSLGMVRGNGERSRTKGRKKPGGYKR